MTPNYSTSTATTSGSLNPCSCCGQYTWSTNNAFITVTSPTYQEKIESLKALSELLFTKVSDELKALIEKKIMDILVTI